MRKNVLAGQCTVAEQSPCLYYRWSSFLGNVKSGISVIAPTPPLESNCRSVNFTNKFIRKIIISFFQGQVNIPFVSFVFLWMFPPPACALWSEPSLVQFLLHSSQSQMINIYLFISVLSFPYCIYLYRRSPPSSLGFSSASIIGTFFIAIKMASLNEFHVTVMSIFIRE